MLSEDEAFWAGIAVATVMLGIGFSVLFIRTYWIRRNYLIYRINDLDVYNSYASDTQRTN